MISLLLQNPRDGTGVNLHDLHVISGVPRSLVNGVLTLINEEELLVFKLNAFYDTTKLRLSLKAVRVEHKTKLQDHENLKFNDSLMLYLL